jgi:hypothetical protein
MRGDSPHSFSPQSTDPDVCAPGKGLIRDGKVGRSSQRIQSSTIPSRFGMVETTRSQMCHVRHLSGK